AGRARRHELSAVGRAGIANGGTARGDAMDSGGVRGAGVGVVAAGVIGGGVRRRRATGRDCLFLALVVVVCALPIGGGVAGGGLPQQRAARGDAGFSVSVELEKLRRSAGEVLRGFVERVLWVAGGLSDFGALAASGRGDVRGVLADVRGAGERAV